MSSSDRAKDTQRTAASSARETPGLKSFRADPVKGARSLLQLSRPDRLQAVLADRDFRAGLERLALDARTSPKAAAVLSKFATRSTFLDAVTAAVSTAGAWAPPSAFPETPDRQLVSDALERVRPDWALSWLAEALVLAAPDAELRHYFAMRLLLVAGGLAGAADALARSLVTFAYDGGRFDGNHVALIHELRGCARGATAPPSADGAPVAALIYAMLSDQTVDNIVEIKSALASLLRDVGQADRSVAPDEVVLVAAGQLDPDLPEELRDRGSKGGLDAAKTLPGADQAEFVRAAAWMDADGALARAVQDMGVLARAFEQLETVVEDEAADRARRARGASNLVLQWVRQAARERSIMALNQTGEHVAFDPLLHWMEDEGVAGDQVRVIKPTIVRGTGSNQIVLIRGEVEPA